MKIHDKVGTLFYYQVDRTDRSRPTDSIKNPQPFGWGFFVVHEVGIGFADINRL